MTWVIFDEADHRKPAPYFCLPGPAGRTVCLGDFHERSSLVLIFTLGHFCQPCREFLATLNCRRSEYQMLDAELLAILPDPVSEIESDPELSSLPFQILSDPEGVTRKLYAGLMDSSLVSQDDTLLFVLDRYSAPYAAWIGKDLKDRSLQENIQSWLSFIGVQCPE